MMVAPVLAKTDLGQRRDCPIVARSRGRLAGLAFPRQSAPIGTNSSLDGRKRENGSGLDALAARKSRGSGGVGSGPGRKFLRYHPATFCTRSSAAGGYPSQAHRDHALSVNPELKPIGLEFPVRRHFFTVGSGALFFTKCFIGWPPMHGLELPD